MKKVLLIIILVALSIELSFAKLTFSDQDILNSGIKSEIGIKNIKEHTAVLDWIVTGSGIERFVDLKLGEYDAGIMTAVEFNYYQNFMIYTEYGAARHNLYEIFTIVGATVDMEFLKFTGGLAGSSFGLTIPVTLSNPSDDPSGKSSAEVQDFTAPQFLDDYLFLFVGNKNIANLNVFISMHDTFVPDNGQLKFNSDYRINREFNWALGLDIPLAMDLNFHFGSQEEAEADDEDRNAKLSKAAVALDSIPYLVYGLILKVDSFNDIRTKKSTVEEGDYTALNLPYIEAGIKSHLPISNSAAKYERLYAQLGSYSHLMNLKFIMPMPFWSGFGESGRMALSIEGEADFFDSTWKTYHEGAALRDFILGARFSYNSMMDEGDSIEQAVSFGAVLNYSYFTDIRLYELSGGESKSVSGINFELFALMPTMFSINAAISYNYAPDLNQVFELYEVSVMRLYASFYI